MPVGRKLNDVAPLKLSPAYLKAMFAKYGTTCESPECVDDPHPPVGFYQTRWVVIFLCQAQLDVPRSLFPRELLAWERGISEHMYGLLLRKSYAFANIQSGYDLDRAIEERDDRLRQIARLESSQATQDRADLRRQIKESAVSVGMPDDEILTARGRAALKAGIIKPSTRTADTIAAVRAKLVVPLIIPRRSNDNQYSTPDENF